MAGHRLGKIDCTLGTEEHDILEEAAERNRMTSMEAALAADPMSPDTEEAVVAADPRSSETEETVVAVADPRSLETVVAAPEEWGKGQTLCFAAWPSKLRYSLLASHVNSLLY